MLDNREAAGRVFSNFLCLAGLPYCVERSHDTQKQWMVDLKSLLSVVQWIGTRPRCICTKNFYLPEETKPPWLLVHKVRPSLDAHKDQLEEAVVVCVAEFKPKETPLWADPCCQIREGYSFLCFVDV